MHTKIRFSLLLPLVALALTACRSQCPPQRPDASVAAPATPSNEGRIIRTPVLRLTERGGMGSLVQYSGVPTFTLYEDGLAVFAEGTGKGARAMQVKLPPEAVDELVEYANDKLGQVPSQIEATRRTDAPEATIGVTHQGRIYSVRVYGFGDSPELVTTPIPEAFLEVYHRLKSFEHDAAEPWQPDELEVILGRRDDMAERANAWPGSFPAPPADAREPRPRIVGRNGKTIVGPIRYRIDGSLRDALPKTRDEDGKPVPYAWRDTAWAVTVQPVVPARTYFW